MYEGFEGGIHHPILRSDERVHYVATDKKQGTDESELRDETGYVRVDE